MNQPVGYAIVWFLALCAPGRPNHDVNNRLKSEDVKILAVHNVTDGIQLSVVSDSNSIVLTSQGQYIPPECGENYFRCENLQSLVISREGKTQYVIFVPVIRAVLIVILQYDYNSSRFDLFDNYTLAVPTGCSPIRFFFEILNRIYTTCMNLEEGYLTVLELYLNVSSVQSSHFGPPLTDSNLNIADITQTSKFVYADLGNEFHGARYQILFLTGNYLEGFDPSVYRLIIRVNIENCRPTSEIRYIGSQTLLVYCNDSAVYVDLAHQAVHDRQPFDESGYPFLCPNGRVEFFYHRNTSCLTYNRNQASFDCINISSISSGSCFGANSDMFVYTDAKRGAVNAIVVAEDGNVTEIMLSPNSHGVMLFNNRYVVISTSEENATVVVDSQANFSTIIMTRNLRPDLTTILTVERSVIPQSSSTSVPTPKPTSTPTGVPATSSQSTPGTMANSHIKQIVIPVVVVVVAVGVAVSILAIVVYCCRKPIRRWPWKSNTENERLLEHELQQPVPIVEDGLSQVVPSEGHANSRCIANDIQQPTDSDYQTAQYPLPESVINPVQSTDQEGQTLNSSRLVATELCTNL